MEPANLVKTVNRMKPVGNVERILAGAFGGVLPMIVNVLRVNPTTMFKDFEAEAFLGLCVHAALLASIGAVIGFFQKLEKDAWRIVVFAISAPAVITAANNAVIINQAKESTKTGTETTQTKIRGSADPGVFRPTSIAARHKSETKAGFKKTASIASDSPAADCRLNDVSVLRRVPEDGPADAFWRGVFARERQQGYFIVLGSTPDEAAAKQKANCVNEVLLRKKSEFKAYAIQKPFVETGNAEPYLILIGSDANGGLRFTRHDLKVVAFRDSETAMKGAQKVADALGRKVLLQT